MDKVLVEIYCAASGKNYEFLLPGKMKVKTAIKKLMEQIICAEENEDLFPNPQNCLLADRDSREILNDSFTLEQAGVIGGNRLILV